MGWMLETAVVVVREGACQAEVGKDVMIVGCGGWRIR